MGDDHSIWLTSMFMQQHDISEFLPLRCIDNVLKSISTSVEPNTVGKEQIHLFLELHEFGTRSARCGDHNLGFGVPVDIVLVVDVVSDDCVTKTLLIVLSSLLSSFSSSSSLSLKSSVGSFLFSDVTNTITVVGLLHLELFDILFSGLLVLFLVEQVLLSEADILPEHAAGPGLV